MGHTRETVSFENRNGLGVNVKERETQPSHEREDGYVKPVTERGNSFSR